MDLMFKHLSLLWWVVTVANCKTFKSFSAKGTPSNTTFYPNTESNVDFSLLEKTILKFWEDNKIFKRSIEERPKNNRFVFYDGPPFANGRPHYGHLLTGYIKDTYGRYQTMRGKRVERGFGWDCHGLPTEMATEQELNISGKTDIEKFGIAKFNKRCKDTVRKYASAWDSYVTRQGRWVDVKHGYMTMNISYMESVMWAFKQLYDKGLVYESERVVPYSWACQSPVSNFETRLDNCYRTKSSKAVTVAFELLKKPPRLENLDPPLKILVWTTTPWTLPSNLALAVGKNITYTVVWMQPSYGRRGNHSLYILATNYLQKFGELCDGKNLDYQKTGIEFTYKDLVGIPYKPLFPYFEKTPNAFRVVESDHVSAEEGTGTVHIAPGFGEDDFDLCKRLNIPVVCPVDSDGRFTAEVSDFNGTRVFDANNEIVKYLKANKNWFHTEVYSHSYPHCWRSDTPLIYRTMPSWYVAVTKIKKRMAELNKKVNWIPEHVRDGLFGNWIEGAQDWSISRNRFWGTPIPLWKSDNPKFPRIDVYGSIEELERDFGKKINDLHRPFIDNLTRPNPDDPSGKSIMRRIPDIFDCWFDSGSMPFAQYHYPFTNKEVFKENFPSDFVTEYIAQTRGWFYTLFVLSTALFDREPFKNCICHGVVLDGRGQKFSKSVKNYIDPAVLIVKYGSDAFRFLMLSRPVVVGDNLMLDKQGNSAEEVLRVIVKPIWNSYNFFTLYANSDGLKANISTNPANYQNTIDKYILLKCYQAVEEINQSLANYNTQEACKTVNDFFEVLNNWYIRRTRDRFWKTDRDQDKLDAYNALYTVLNHILRASAPLLPFLTETIWQGLHFAETSVHLSEFPIVDKFYSHPIIVKMDFVRGICNAAMYLRKLKRMRVRQPLKSMRVYHEDSKNLLDDEYKKVIKEEINVKNIILENTFEDLAERQLQLKFPVIGKRIPDKVKRIVELLSQGKWKIVDNSVVLIGDEQEGYIIFENEYELKLRVKGDRAYVFDDGKGVVELDLTLDDELILEGYARDVVRSIQETRKQADLHISDKIRVTIRTDKDKIKEAINKWMDYIKEQTLAFSVEVVSSISGDLFSRKYDNLDVAIRVYHEIT